MIDSELTNILPKRIAASFIDLGIVGLLSALVASSQRKVFEFSSLLPNGKPNWGPDELAELRVIDEQINRQITFGSSMWVWHGRGLALSVLALVVFSLVAWVLVPANTGWSAGHRIMGLRVTDKKGNKPPLDSYLRRYLVGILDLAPFVIPGLLGWFVASRNEHRQRIGDLSADTVVIDANKPLKLVDPDVDHAALTSQRAAREAADAAASADLNTMVNVDDAVSAPETDLAAILPTGLSSSASGSATQEVPILDLEVPAALNPNAAPPVPEPVDTVPSDAAPSETAPSETAPSETVPFEAVAEEAPFDPVAEDREILEIRDIPEEPDSQSQFVSALEQVDASAEVEPEPDDDKPKPTWHMPEAEPAPVWDPSAVPAANVQGAEKAENATAAAAATATANPKPDSPEHDLASSELAPMWNEEWQAWLFWDPKNNQWLRHDPGANVWVPIPA